MKSTGNSNHSLFLLKEIKCMYVCIYVCMSVCVHVRSANKCCDFSICDSNSCLMHLDIYLVCKVSYSAKLILMISYDTHSEFFLTNIQTGFMEMYILNRLMITVV